VCSSDLRVAALHEAGRGDTIIVISYAGYAAEELASYEPRVVHVTRENAIHAVDAEVATLAA